MKGCPNVALWGALVLVGWVAGLPAAAAAAADHDYLRAEGRHLESTHALPFAIELPEGFEARYDLDYPQVWNDIPFRVSVAIFDSEEAIIQVYAETLPKGYGRLGYSELPPVEIAGVVFHLRERCYDPRELTEEEIESVPSRAALREMGLEGVLVRQQYFVTSEDGLAELALSYDMKADSCEQATEEFRAAVSREAEEAFKTLRRLQ